MPANRPEKWWLVVSPEYENWQGVYRDPPEPPEYGCDVVEVEASNKREAVIAGVLILLRTVRKSYAHANRADGQPPFAGFHAEEMPNV